MAEDFAQHLILHGHIGFAPHVIAKLRLDHAEGAFDVGPLVIVPQELQAVEGKVVKHLLPEPPGSPAMDALEGDVGRGPMASDDVRVVHAGIALVGGDFPHVEMLRRGGHEVRQELRITRVFLPDFHSRDHIRFDATHQMDLDPLVLLAHDTILVIEPANKAGGGKAG